MSWKEGLNIVERAWLEKLKSKNIIFRFYRGGFFCEFFYNRLFYTYINYNLPNTFLFIACCRYTYVHTHFFETAYYECAPLLGESICISRIGAYCSAVESNTWNSRSKDEHLFDCSIDNAITIRADVKPLVAVYVEREIDTYLIPRERMCVSSRVHTSREILDYEKAIVGGKSKQREIRRDISKFTGLSGRLLIGKSISFSLANISLL